MKKRTLTDAFSFFVNRHNSVYRYLLIYSSHNDSDSYLTAAFIILTLSYLFSARCNRTGR